MRMKKIIVTQFQHFLIAKIKWEMLLAKIIIIIIIMKERASYERELKSN